MTPETPVPTRVFADSGCPTNADAADPVPRSIDDPDARETLVARTAPDGYRLDIRIQGEGETVFFDI